VLNNVASIQVVLHCVQMALSLSISVALASLINKKLPCSLSSERGIQMGILSFNNWLEKKIL